MFKIICLLAILSVVYCASVTPLENINDGDSGVLDEIPPITAENTDDLERSEHRWGGWGRRYGGWGGYGGYRSYGWGYPRHYGGWGYPRYHRSYYW